MSPAFRVSLAVNVLLLGVAGALLWRDRPSVPPPPLSMPPAPPPAATPSPPTRDGARPAEFSPVGSPPSKLTPAAVAELEQSGIPREIIVNVLLADLNRRWNARLLALQRQYAPAPVPEKELRALARQTTTDQVGELRTALGEEGYQAWDREQALRTLNRARPPGDELPMTAAEAEQAYRLQKAFDDEYRELQETMEDGAANAGDIGRLQAQAQQTLDRALEQLLGRPRFDALRGNPAPPAQGTAPAKADSP
jgi:hypothetical protein